MIPAWLPVALVLGFAYGVFLAAVLRAPRRHARVLPRPRPHRVFMTGAHTERGQRRAYAARHGA